MIKKILLSQTISLPEVGQTAMFLLSQIQSSVWLINGVPGAGKTTLIKALCLGLGVKDNVSSPSFSLANSYQGKDRQIWHLDLYRLSDLAQAQNIGIEEMLYSGNICFVEWPEIILPILPDRYVIIDIEMVSNQANCRNIIVTQYENRI